MHDMVLSETMMSHTTMLRKAEVFPAYFDSYRYRNAVAMLRRNSPVLSRHCHLTSVDYSGPHQRLGMPSSLTQRFGIRRHCFKL